MQKLWIMLVLSVALYACQGPVNTGQDARDAGVAGLAIENTRSEAEQAPVDTANAPKFEFEAPIYTFGTIQEGEKIEHVYTFTNVGKTPLIISDVQASCGCTTPEFTRDPVKPGDTGSIKVVFDSQGQRGKQQKIISILSNAHPRMHHVQLKGEVQE